MKKVILKVNSNPVMISVWFMAFFTFVSLLTFLWLGFCDDGVSFLCVLPVIFSLSFVSVWYFFDALYLMQRAELTDEGIFIRSVLCNVKKIEWSELVEVRIESIATFTSRGYSSFKDWIVLYTEPSQEEKERHPRNRKKKGPWCITATSNNTIFLADYLKKHAPHIHAGFDSLL